MSQGQYLTLYRLAQAQKLAIKLAQQKELRERLAGVAAAKAWNADMAARKASKGVPVLQEIADVWRDVTGGAGVVLVDGKEVKSSAPSTVTTVAAPRGRGQPRKGGDSKS